MKKPVLWGLGILIVLAIVGFTAGPWIYREFTPPDFAGFVTVEPTGTIEFLVNLAKQ